VVARLSQALLPARTLLDVLRGVDRFVRSPLGAAVTLLGLAEDGCSEVRVWTTFAGVPPSAHPGPDLQLGDRHPLAAAVRERRLVAVASRSEGLLQFPGPILLPGGAVESSLSAPLVLGQHASTGGLLIGWEQNRELEAQVCRVVSDLVRHVGYALDRVLLRHQRLNLATDSAPVPVIG
jgi:hypothetical protein